MEPSISLLFKKEEKLLNNGIQNNSLNGLTNKDMKIISKYSKAKK
jgi:hypothetical protein